MNDEDYKSITNHILNNEEFMKIENIEHHGLSRYEHSVKVSYYSYKIAKALKLDYEETATGALLHDFFLSPEDRTKYERIISTFVHPKKAARNANDIFGITRKEEDIIKSHMFPVNLTVPKYAESWIVNLVDKMVGTYEFAFKFKDKFSYAVNLYLIFFINTLK